MRKAVFVILQIICIVACSKQNDLEEKFINSDSEYWVVYAQNQPNYTFWRFNENKTADKLLRNNDGKLETFNIDGDLIIGPENWNLKSRNLKVERN